MNKFLLFLVYLVSTCFLNNVSAQDFNFSDLGILQSHKLEYIEDYLSRRGWEFNSSTIESDPSGDSCKLATWSLNINDYNKKAQAWLYLRMFEGCENILIYQTNKDNFGLIKEEIKKTKFIHSKSDIADNALYSVYENSPYKVIFNTTNNDDDDNGYSDNSDKITNMITILNYVEYNRHVLAFELLAYQRVDAIRVADSIKNVRYIEAIRIAELRKQDSINNVEQLKLIQFLKIRKNTIYNYEIENPSDYKSIETEILTTIRSYLQTETGNVNCKLELVYTVDTLNNNKFECNIVNASNQMVVDKIMSIVQAYKLKPVTKNNYLIKAKAIFIIDALLDNQIVVVSKNLVETKYLSNNGSNYTSEVNSILSAAPIGHYKISIARKRLNNSDFSNNKIVKFSNIGGPSNALKAFVAPGWGVGRVTGGQKSGVLRTVSVYGLVIASAGFKLNSDSEYKKYHNSTIQSDLDDHFSKADISNKIFMACVGTAAILWIYDIIWTTDKGYKNNKIARSFRRNLTFLYDPSLNQSSFAFNFKF